jgi:malonyl-CoA O-methyltransferase
MLDKELIKQNFSRSAAEYDRHAAFQQQLAADLLASLPALKPKKVLDIGCGTGQLTVALAARFPQAEVVGLDLAPGMIEAAKKRGDNNVKFIVGDGEELSGEREWDLVVSNAALQWMDAARTFDGVARLLKPKGLLAFSTFGPQTLVELRTSGFQVNSFPSPDELRKVAAPLFTRVELTARTSLIGFPSVKELIYYLKELGANTAAGQRRADLSAFRRFREQHPLVTATFEVVGGLLFK